MDLKKFSLVSPLKDKVYEYLDNFYTSKSIENTQELLTKEKAFIDVIIALESSKNSKIDAWKNYYKFVMKYFKKDKLRIFLFLEQFTKSMLIDREFYNHSDYLDFWIYYGNMCADEAEMFIFLKKREIGAKMAKFYYFMMIHYEQEHKFEKANEIMLEGLSRNLDDQSFLKNNYNIFEQRMENRLNRELMKSKIKNEELNYHIQKELNKSGDFKSDLCKFTIKSNKINFLENNYLNTLKHGEINVYIDPENRTKLITRCSQVVEIYRVLCKFLCENDNEFKKGILEYDEKVLIERSKKPFSWLNNLRTLNKIFAENEKLTATNPVESSNNLKITTNLEGIKPQITALSDDNVVKKKSNLTNIEKLLEVIKNNTNNSIINNDAKLTLVNNNNSSVQNEKNISKEVIFKNLQTNNLNKEIKLDPQSYQDKIPPIEDETKDRKIKLIKKEIPVSKPVKMYINFEGLRDKDSATIFSLEEVRAKKYFKKIQELKAKEEETKRLEALRKKRKTIIYHVDSDGDIIMSSDEEEKRKEDEILKNYLEYSKKKLMTKRFNEDNSINLWDSIEKTKINVLEEIKKIEELISMKSITEDQKIVLFEDLESKMNHLENLNKNFELRKMKNGKADIKQPFQKENLPRNSPKFPLFNGFPQYLNSSDNMNEVMNKIGKIDNKDNNASVYQISSISGANNKNNDITNNIFSTVTRSIDFNNLSFNEDSNKKDKVEPEVYNSLFSNFKEEKENNMINYFKRNESLVNSTNFPGNSIQNNQVKGKNEKSDVFPQKRENIKLIMNNNTTNNYTSLNTINFDNKIPLNNNYTTLINIDSKNCLNKNNLNGLLNIFGNSNERTSFKNDDLNYKLSNITEKPEYSEENSFIFKMN